MYKPLEVPKKLNTLMRNQELKALKHHDTLLVLKRNHKNTPMVSMFF